MSVVESMEQSGNETTAEVQIPLYEWNGESFEKIQTVRTYGTKKITPFFIADTSYLAVANSEGKNGKIEMIVRIPTISKHKSK